MPGNRTIAGHGVSMGGLLLVTPTSGSRNALPPKCFALFAPFEFAGFFVAFFQLQPLKKAIVLDLLFQNAHGFFEVIVVNLDFDFFQPSPPPLLTPAGCPVGSPMLDLILYIETLQINK